MSNTTLIIFKDIVKYTNRYSTELNTNIPYMANTITVMVSLNKKTSQNERLKPSLSSRLKAINLCPYIVVPDTATIVKKDTIE